MKIVFLKSAVKRLMDLPPRQRAALMMRLTAIAADPFAPHANVKALKGEADAFRLRLGDWRAVYRLDHAAGEMRVGPIEPRGSVYQ